jgi:hypothetical protein
MDPEANHCDHALINSYRSIHWGAHKIDTSRRRDSTTNMDDARFTNGEEAWQHFSTHVDWHMWTGTCTITTIIIFKN